MSECVCERERNHACTYTKRHARLYLHEKTHKLILRNITVNIFHSAIIAIVTHRDHSVSDG